MEQGQQRSKARATAAAIAAACLALACSQSPEVGEYHNVGPHGWLYADSMVMNIDSVRSDADALAPSDIAIAIRHTNNYEYSSIWVELSTVEAVGDSTVERVDTFNIQLADAFGRWKGSGIGVGFQMVDTVRHDVRLAPGSRVKLRHVMRADTLADIEQAGIIIAPPQ